LPFVGRFPELKTPFPIAKGIDFVGWLPCRLEAKGRAPTIVAPRRVVDTWNYIINGLCVAVRMGGPVRLDLGCPCLSCHGSG
jgi:hypothetical protein